MSDSTPHSCGLNIFRLQRRHTHYHEIAAGQGTSLDFPNRYAGDMPSISADVNGRAEGSFLMPTFTVDEKFAIKDRAIILHGGPDDVTKKSAPRIACGVIHAG